MLHASAVNKSLSGEGEEGEGKNLRKQLLDLPKVESSKEGLGGSRRLSERRGKEGVEGTQLGSGLSQG